MACDWFMSNARWKIAIEARTETVDSYGGQNITWATNSEPYAVVEVIDLLRTAQFKGGTLEPYATHRFTIRFDDDYANIATIANYRIVHDDRTFKIISVVNKDQTRKLYGKHYHEILAQDNGPINE